jgi:hypothetical protein
MACSDSNVKAFIGNDEILLELDKENSQMKIEVVNVSRLVVHRKIISKAEEVHNITGIT